MRVTTVGNCTLYNEDCMAVMASLDENSVDSIVCDPPYHLTSIVKRFGKDGAAPAKHGTDGAYARASTGFMGRVWDGGDIAFQPETWAACLRVLKPGGYIVAFASTRGFGRMSVAMEDAGFITHPMLAWIFGSGFPKATRVNADGYDGFRYGGQALKPALEPVYMGQKPFSEKTGTANILRWGTGALNIDGCRVGTNDALLVKGRSAEAAKSKGILGDSKATVTHIGAGQELGRWPANIIHDGSDEVMAAFPDAKGQQGKSNDSQRTQANVYGATSDNGKEYEPRIELDTSAARFFYCAKASRKDRDEGLGGFAVQDAAAMAGNLVSGQRLAGNGTPIATPKRANIHPTVKPTSLMQYLCRLITPPGGTILDPFMGSGSTGKAAVLEGFNFFGIEREDEYMPIAEARIAWAVLRMKGGIVDLPSETTTIPQQPANDNLPADLFTQASA